jgi:hypothetical protein
VGPFTTDHEKAAQEMRLPISAPGVMAAHTFRCVTCCRSGLRTIRKNGARW